jgi:O-antigen/teichoic acid export membrane protein
MWINNASGRFLLERYTSLTELGIFALAAQFSGILFFLSNALDNAILPYFYETAQKSEGADILSRFFSKYFALFGLISLFTLTVAQPLVLIMADSKFHEAVIYIPLLILAGWIRIIFKIFHWNLMHSKKTGLIATLRGISALLIVSLLFISLKYLNMGIHGVIYAMILVALFNAVTGYFFSQKYFRIKYNSKEIGLAFLVLLLGALIINYASFSSLFLLNTLIKICIFAVASYFILRISKIETLKMLALIKTW